MVLRTGVVSVLPLRYEHDFRKSKPILRIGGKTMPQENDGSAKHELRTQRVMSGQQVSSLSEVMDLLLPLESDIQPYSQVWNTRPKLLTNVVRRFTCRALDAAKQADPGTLLKV